MADECSFDSDEDCDSITVTHPVLQHANRKRKQESDAVLSTSKCRKESLQWVLSSSLYYVEHVFEMWNVRHNGYLALGEPAISYWLQGRYHVCCSVKFCAHSFHCQLLKMKNVEYNRSDQWSGDRLGPSGSRGFGLYHTWIFTVGENVVNWASWRCITCHFTCMFCSSYAFLYITNLPVTDIKITPVGKQYSMLCMVHAWVPNDRIMILKSDFSQLSWCHVDGTPTYLAAVS